jgi:hypothetical protein
MIASMSRGYDRNTTPRKPMTEECAFGLLTFSDLLNAARKAPARFTLGCL